MRVLTGAAAAAMLVLALTGCGSQATEPTTTPTVTVAPTTVAPTATASATASAAPDGTGTAPPATGDPDRPANQCPDSALGVSVVPAQGGGSAGSLEYEVLFTNTSGSTCALRGTPGVSVIGANGARLGDPAARLQTGVRTLQLRDGASVSAPLRIVDIGTNGGPLDGCTVRKGAGYRVYPPHSTKGFVVQDSSAVACAPGPSFMTVGPVQPQAD